MCDGEIFLTEHTNVIQKIHSNLSVIQSPTQKHHKQQYKKQIPAAHLYKTAYMTM